MTKLKTFWKTFVISATDLDYAKDVLKAKFSFSFKYFVFLMYVLSLVSGVFIAGRLTRYFPQVPSLQEKLRVGAKEFYPQDLVLTFADGKLTTNVDEPYFIELPAAFGQTPQTGYDHFITIDTAADLSAISTYKTAILLTKSGAFYPDNDSYRAFPYSDLEDMTIDRGVYDTMITQALPYVDYLPQVVAVLIVAFIVLIPLVMTVFSVVGRLIYLFFGAALVWLLGKLMGRSLTYGNAYQLGLHLLTVPTIYAVLMGALGAHLPFVYTLIFLVFAGLWLARLPKVAKA